MTSENMFINSTNFPETKHELIVNDGRPNKARAAIMGLQLIHCSLIISYEFMYNSFQISA